MKKTLATVILSAGAAALTSLGVVKYTAPEPVQTATVNLNDGAAYRTVNLTNTDYPDFTFAAESAVDAVVYVKVTVQKGVVQSYNSIFDFIFDNPHISPREMVGSGSGVIIRSDGYIVTNNHVVGDATKIEVTLNNNQSYEAYLVGTDPATDVAIIKIQAEGLPTVPFGDSDKLRLGEWVIAIGSPYDLRSTITAGIVSAKGRSMPNYGREVKIESFIQTDAAVNPGNSGGALVNKAGQLVGVNTAIISQTGSYAGYSFAIPSNMVAKIAEDLINYGSVKRVALGVSVGEIDAKKAAELKLSAPMGVYISEVSENSGAKAAGVKAGDVLIAVDSTPVNSFAQLQECLSRFRPTDSAVLKVIREGQVLELTVVFPEPPVQVR